MTSTTNAPSEPNDHADVDPIDHEAATIDARSEDAPQKIEALIERSEELGREATQPIEPGDDDEPDLLPG